MKKKLPLGAPISKKNRSSIQIREEGKKKRGAPAGTERTLVMCHRRVRGEKTQEL